MNVGDRGMPSVQSRFVQTLKSLPVVNSGIEAYHYVKSLNSVFAYFSDVVENGVCGVMDRVLNAPGAADVDYYASEKVEEMKTYFPIIQKPMKKIIKKTKYKAMKNAQYGANGILDSRLGRYFMLSLDRFIRKSEKMLNYLNSDTKPKRTVTSPISKSRPEDREEAYRRPEAATVTSSKGQQTSPRSVPEVYKEQMGVLLGDVALRSRATTVLTYPLELMVRGLKTLHRSLRRASGRPVHQRVSQRKVKKAPMTPEKLAEIDSRRKISPKKRINVSLFGNLCSLAFWMLGMEKKSGHQTDIRDFLKYSRHRAFNQQPMIGDDIEKRKHDDISDDEYDDSTDEDLMYMDLEYYESDEDPDYVPSYEDEDSESIASDEADTESDVELEVTAGNLVQIREREKSKEEPAITPNQDKSHREKRKEEPAIPPNQDKSHVKFADPKDSKQPAPVKTDENKNKPKEDEKNKPNVKPDEHQRPPLPLKTEERVKGDVKKASSPQRKGQDTSKQPHGDNKKDGQQGK